MSMLDTRWLIIDATSLEENGSHELQVKLVAAGAVERTAAGLNVKTGGISNDQLGGSIALAKLADAAEIVLRDQTEAITGEWTFDVAAPPKIGTDTVTTKEYVDALVQGLKPKAPCRVVSTTNIADLTAIPANVDGVTDLAADDRILLTGQTTDASENGIWIIKDGVPWVRPDDFPAGGSAGSAFTFIQEGTLHADTGWVCTNDAGDDVIDTDDLVFVQFSAAGVILPGNGLNQVGDTFNVVPLELVKGGNAEIAGNNLQVSYVPTNYVPTLIAGVTTTDQLGAHLKGLDDAISAVGEAAVDRFTLSAGDITAKYVTLTAVPKSATRVTLTVAGGPGQEYGDDYVMDGVNPDRLTWASLGLDGVLIAGDKLTVRYDV